MEQLPPSVTPAPQETTTPQKQGDFHSKKNLYPYIRHILLASAILCAFAVIIFLMYQNGKSIYDNGI
jgi:hypothetical protein